MWRAVGMDRGNHHSDISHARCIAPVPADNTEDARTDRVRDNPELQPGWDSHCAGRFLRPPRTQGSRRALAVDSPEATLRIPSANPRRSRGRQLRHIDGRRVCLNPGNLAKIIDRMRSVACAATDTRMNKHPPRSRIPAMSSAMRSMAAASSCRAICSAWARNTLEKLVEESDTFDTASSSI